MKFQSGSARQGASVCSRRCVVLGQPSKNVAQGWQRQRYLGGGGGGDTNEPTNECAPSDVAATRQQAEEEQERITASS